MNNNYLLLAIFSVIVASVSQVLLKLGVKKKYSTKIREYLNPYVITGYGMLLVSMLLTVAAYKNLSYLSVPVVESLGYILVPFFSVMIFREKMRGKKLLGMLLILIGIFLYHI